MKTWQKVLLGLGALAVAYRYRGAIKGLISPAAPSAPFVPPVAK